ncbi:hypothetical protein A5882_003517 [Enterococcus sp. 4E1_DIV0656]|uniref:hypothetical protein n=1 Tax=Enterococcus sp. 4E1_DIV0656 TaxID=1834180 RepID=UPI000A36A5C3|nr:hypothetical protein [Enterococcus sp. 4E1_DIV0656]OTO09187.1 hypothetical protein A5882_003517 [Enterococcus sp. 4E1_DIV0656]
MYDYETIGQFLEKSELLKSPNSISDEQKNLLLMTRLESVGQSADENQINVQKAIVNNVLTFFNNSKEKVENILAAPIPKEEVFLLLDEEGKTLFERFSKLSFEEFNALSVEEKIEFGTLKLNLVAALQTVVDNYKEQLVRLQDQDYRKVRDLTSRISMVQSINIPIDDEDDFI